VLFFLMTSMPTLADRAPVLQQIKVPHDYYFREMYLPQVSSGPQSPGWSPDGKSLVFAMQGSLWRQDIDSKTAVQLTAGPGYDHQPDWSPDGKKIVFARYLGNAIHLIVLEVSSGKETQLTHGADVNLEPKWSPDGGRIAFVSTRQTGRFLIYIGDYSPSTFSVSPFTDETHSDISRYYYSPFDHQISPAWSHDGESLIYVSNPETPYGTGSIWRRNIDGSGEPVLLRREETTWRARPDPAPDSKRLVYASYLGRQWHQLWMAGMTNVAEPFPLTYGEFDIASPRWSPDGRHIAYGINEHGNTSIRIQEIPGAGTIDLTIDERRYKNPTGTLDLTITDSAGHPTSARISVVASDGRSYVPDALWAHADDSFDRDLSEFETHYFHATKPVHVTVPTGTAKVAVWRGLEHRIERRSIDIKNGASARLSVSMEPLDLPQDWNLWLSGDVHVHMNYGGIYRNTPENLVRQAQAEDLDVLFNLIVNKEQRFPDISYFSPDPDTASNGDVVLLHSQEFHTSYWGHVGLLGLNDHILLPGYSAYPGTGAASLFPDNVKVAELANVQNALVGYVHPFLAPAPNPSSDKSLTSALPVNAALGKADYIEVVGFADPRASAEVWYRLLNCGFRLVAAGGTDAMANYASLRGPVGVNRVYVQMAENPADPAMRRDLWLKGLKAGRTLATNGPLLGLTVNGQPPGAELEFETGHDSGSQELKYSGFLRSIVPVDHLELVYNGKVVRTIDLGDELSSSNFSGTLKVKESGWLLVRAWNDGSHPDVFDLYPYATTNPVFVTLGNDGPRSTRDADYFIAWIRRIRESATTHPDYNSAEERDTVLFNLDEAIRVFENRR
jgi:hypothetical protein